MLLNPKRFILFPFVLLFVLLFSCKDEYPATTLEKGRISVRSLNNPDHIAGDGIDDNILTLRILAFDAATGACKSNALYLGAALAGNTLIHAIHQGEYNFIFLANEPSVETVKAQLEGITTYNDIKGVVYPAESFGSGNYIPMIAENKKVGVLANGKITVDGTELTVLDINLRRLATRIDAVLKSKIDLGGAADNILKGVTFSNLPDKVPLAWGLPSTPKAGSWVYDEPHLTYTGPVVSRTFVREFTLAGNAGSFEINSKHLTDDDKANGLVWAAKVSRIILPSNHFDEADKAVESNAAVFTVNLADKYSPSAKLEILPDPDYRIPANARIDLMGVIKEPLEMNIVASQWINNESNWNIPGVRILNVSQLSASITDFNGVRISFQSNMPVVRVLPTVSKDGVEMDTNRAFNDLAIDDSAITGDVHSTNRFAYNRLKGTGYMDILVDGGIGAGNATGTYKLILSAAEDKDGYNSLEREITIRVTQHGDRIAISHWPGVVSGTDIVRSRYVGAFYRDEETGERIITGQHHLNKEWSAWVEGDDSFLILSTTPSFDPHVGTDTPGHAENFKVVPNAFKYEEGHYVEGKGRIYFRIGLKEKNADTATPRYATIWVNYYDDVDEDKAWKTDYIMYVRQGSAPDYVWRPSDMITVAGNVSARTAATKFSPFNLTAQEYLDNDNGPSHKIPKDRKGVFVKYPTQAGTFFQWANRKRDNPNYDYFMRRAYHPTTPAVFDSWDATDFEIEDGIPIWRPSTGAGFEEEFELCPEGYHRPHDGPVDDIAYNYDYIPSISDQRPASVTAYDGRTQILQSEFRMSLFEEPQAGDMYNSIDIDTDPNHPSFPTVYGSYPLTMQGPHSEHALNEGMGGYYADGFFDRRPINKWQHGVSLNNAQAAYGGMLYFNSLTKASVFFPSAGRRLNTAKGRLEYAGSAGYYWAASTAPWYPRMGYGVWMLITDWYNMGMSAILTDFGACIRCAKDKSTGG